MVKTASQIAVITNRFCYRMDHARSAHHIPDLGEVACASLTSAVGHRFCSSMEDAPAANYSLDLQKTWENALLTNVQINKFEPLLVSAKTVPTTVDPQPIRNLAFLMSALKLRYLCSMEHVRIVPKIKFQPKWLAKMERIPQNVFGEHVNQMKLSSLTDHVNNVNNTNDHRLINLNASPALVVLVNTWISTASVINVPNIVWKQWMENSATTLVPMSSKSMLTALVPI